MSRNCTVCNHPQRAELDRLLVEGTPFRQMVEQFGTSLGALSRHKSEHIPAALLKVQEAQEIDYGRDLFAQMKDLSERTLRILAKAEASDDARLALSAIKEARGNLELQCKVICSQMPKNDSAAHREGRGLNYEEDPDFSFLTDEELLLLDDLINRAKERSRASSENTASF